MKARVACVAASALLALACNKPGTGGSAEPPKSEPTAAPPPSALAEAKGLLGAGRVDEAIARLQQTQTPEAWYLLGEAWSKKAESAPLPIPEPLPPDAPRGAVPVTPEFKTEERQAMDLYEKAMAGLPDDPRPKLGLAHLLAPHAQRHYDEAQAAAAAPPPKPVKAAGKKGRLPTPTPTPPPAVASDVDFSPARVCQLMHQASEKSLSTVEPVEALYAFAVRVGELDEADWALRERIRRENENPAHLVRYGDFLREVKKAPDAAIEQYRQALIWRSDDPVPKSRIANIYIDAGNTHYENGEYALAEARYQDAVKWVPDKTSEQWQRLQRELEKVRRLRR
jgi:tetratricopeptide (TPR) repeat protein